MSLVHGRQVYLQPRAITASKCISRLGTLRPASLHDHGLKVHISKLARSRPPRVSPTSLHHGLKVYLQSRLITAFKCISCLVRLRAAGSHDHGLQVQISKLARSRRPSVLPTALNYGHQRWISKIALSQSRSASLCSLAHGLQVYFQICSITATKCISKDARSWPRSISLRSLDRHHQAHLEFLSITACSQSRYSV
jgi:hypothetical protein